MAIIRGPGIHDRAEQLTMGIRTQVPMPGMLKEVPRHFKEINAWVKREKITPADHGIE